jgi:glycosyltransferase involved in cell wall biosynthesis
VRVLHVTHQYPPAVGGAERYIADLSEGLVARGHQVDVYTSRAVDYHTWRNDLPLRETIAGVNLDRFNAWPRRGHTWRVLELGLRHYWPNRSPLWQPLIFYGNGPVMPGLFWTILRRAHDYDLIHISQLHYAHAATAYAAAKLRNMTVVTTPHLHAEQRQTYDIDYLRTVLDGSHMILADTDGEREFLVDQGFPAFKVVTGGSGPNLERFPPRDPATARAQLGLPADAFVVLFLGRKTPYKGLEATLQAFARLRRTHPHAYLIAMGPETAESQQLWQTQGVPAQVLVRGQVDDDERLAALAATDVLLLPSVGEAFGIVYLEAWAYAKPVIGAPIRAVSALIDEGVNGWLIAPERIEAITQRLVWLADHPDEGRAVGEAGRRKLHARYTTQRIAELVEHVYLRAIRRHATHRRPVRV